MKLSSQDLYQIRHAQLAAQKAALKAEQAFRELLLELEERYDLLGADASIDIHTGEVELPSSNGSESHGDAPQQSQGSTIVGPKVGVQE